MKAYTDLEQSRKLAEILPIESADMCYIQDLLAGLKYGEYQPYIGSDLIPAYGQGKIRCWSLAALLEILRNNGRYELQLWDGGYTFEANGFMTESYLNPIDACYEMILSLHERELL